MDGSDHSTIMVYRCLFDTIVAFGMVFKRVLAILLAGHFMCSALFGSLAFGIVFKRCKSNGLMSDIKFGSINSHSRLKLTTLAGMWTIDELVYLVLQWDPSQISEVTDHFML